MPGKLTKLEMARFIMKKAKYPTTTVSGLKKNTYADLKRIYNHYKKK